MKVNGQFDVKVNVEGHVLTHNFFVIENLNEPIIFGINFIEKHELNYCASEKNFDGRVKVTGEAVILKCAPCKSCRRSV